MPDTASGDEKPNPAQAEAPIGSRLWALALNSSVLKAVRLLLLAAAYSPVSQLCLSPVYGSVPSAVYHRKGLMATAMLTWIAKDRLRRALPVSTINFIPAFAFWIPTLQFLLFKQSSFLGQPFGPLITETLTYFPLLLLSIYAAGTYFDQVDLSSFGEILSEHGPAIGSYALFSTAQKFFTTVVNNNIDGTMFKTRAGHQLILAVLYALTLPSNLLIAAIPSLIFSLTSNPHIPLLRTTSLMNSTLQAQNFTLLERTESLTGYLSVIENTEHHFRVMRCDHSLLGGEWTQPSLYKSSNTRVREPVYPVFAMLEAVRLIEGDNGEPRPPDSESTALNIGLGIGTTPTALLTHSINTTIVEIDLAVHRLATKYFGLPANHSAAIVDATAFVAGAIHYNVTAQYDYIIHDVFTGGAEPIELFTFEFLDGLKRLLKADGVIAINYAGDLNAAPARHVVHTIHAVFPRCRMFREDPEPGGGVGDGDSPPEQGKKKGQEPVDFTNLVIFCKPTPNPHGYPSDSDSNSGSDSGSSPSSDTPSLTFRPVTPADTLGSKAREMFLPPRHEVSFKRFGLYRVRLTAWERGRGRRDTSESGRASGRGERAGSQGTPEGTVNAGHEKGKDVGHKGGGEGENKGEEEEEEVTSDEYYHVDQKLVLHKADVRQKMERYAARGAIGHWRLMREVVPGVVWENW